MMNWRTEPKPLGRRLPFLIGLNLGVGLLVAWLWWLLQASGSGARLPDRLLGALVDSLIYGLWFGATMPYLGERLAVLRAPWNWLVICAGLLVSAAASTLLAELSLRALGLLRADGFWAELFFKSLGVFCLALIIAASVYTYEQVQERRHAFKLQLRTQELETERALKLATEARLAALEARLQPHFLFNTLNSISALIAADPARAEATVQGLAGLLRHALDSYAQGRVPLARELAFVTDYLAIEQTRFGARLTYSIDVCEGLDALGVPPFTLQPLVENSVKFAVAQRPEGGRISIAARHCADGLALEVWDDGPGFDAAQIPAGHGLDNLRARLSVLYGAAARLSVSRRDGGACVTVSLPLNAWGE